MKRLLLLLPAVVAAGCGGGSGASQQTGSTTAAGGAALRTITVDETEFALAPASVRLDAPGTYIFRGVNKGTISHAIAVEGNGVDADGPTVQPGEVSVLRVSLTKAGSYEIYCPVDGHKAQGMKGTVTVGAATGSGGGTSTGNQGSSTGGSGY